MVKIVLITPILQHYRLSFYEKLSLVNNDYKLIVFHGIKKVEDGRPGYVGKTKFVNKGFRALKFRIYPFVLVYNWGMYSEIKKIKPDVLIIQGITGDITYRRIISWAKRERKIIIIWGGGWEPGRAQGIILNFKNILVTSFFKKASYFLTYSTNNSKYVESMDIDNSIIKTCYNGIETDDLINNSPETIKKSKEIINKFHLENHITFLYVGGLLAEKKVDLLIDAFIELRKKYNKIKLIIIGDGPQKRLIENKLKMFSDPNILFLGRIIEDVDSFFAASDCLVLPGAGGLALNQAMFWKKTCIVSKADGTEDDLVIEDVTGYRFKENDLASLVLAMDKRINDNQDKVTMMSENSQQIIMNKSNVNNMVDIFSNSIDNLLILNNKNNPK